MELRCEEWFEPEALKAIEDSLPMVAPGETWGALDKSDGETRIATLTGAEDGGTHITVQRLPSEIFKTKAHVSRHGAALTLAYFGFDARGVAWSAIIGRGHDESHVYFAQARSGGPIKIGKSRYPRGRVADLSAGSPFPLVILVTIPESAHTEKSLHKRFASARLRGEWFDPTAELLAFVASLKGEH